jgi:hypothetical protein
MGHDITAYPKDTATSDEAEEIAYLQRSAFNPLNGQIYEFLNCPEENCGVSGCGGEKIFTQEDLKRGMDKLLTYPEDDTKPEKEFLQKCLDCGEDILIHFC